MLHRVCVVALLLTGLAGCASKTPGTSRSLGDVDYDEAFAASRQVMAQYFPLAQIDEQKGLIISQPTPLAQQRLVGGSQVRQVAQVRLHREPSTVVIQASVQVQRQSAAMFRQMRSAGADSASLMTPAELEAATTADQNEVWTVLRQDQPLEARLLEQIFSRAHNPTTQKVIMER